MFSISNTLTSLNYDDCTYLNTTSRPSKTIIDCDKYKLYSKIDKNIDIIYEFSYINHQNKPKEFFILQEIINKLKIIDDYKYSFALSFDTIIINEMEHNNIIISLDTEINIRKLIENVISILKIIENDNILILSFVHLYTYTSIELLMILSGLFNKVKIFYCKLIQKNIFIGLNYKHNGNIIVFFKNVYTKLNKNTYIKKFGVNLEKSYENKVLNYNSIIFDYYINIYNKYYIIELIEEKEYLFKRYQKKNRIIKNIINCNHDLTICNFHDCYICKKCYELFNLFY